MSNQFTLNYKNIPSTSIFPVSLINWINNSLLQQLKLETAISNLNNKISIHSTQQMESNYSDFYKNKSKKILNIQVVNEFNIELINKIIIVKIIFIVLFFIQK